MTKPPSVRVLLVLCVVLAVGACTAPAPTTPPATTLRVLASSELADMQPLLDDLRRDTGIELVLDYQGSVAAADSLAAGDHRHDLAWLSSERYFHLKLQATRNTRPRPLSTKIMSSPVVIGVRPKTAELLRREAPDPRLSWADIADAAAVGRVRFGMADPSRTNSGLSALIGVATAAAGTGSALRPQDVTCDRLRGFLTGRTMTAETSNLLVDQFVARQADTDALITYESVLLSLNASGRLTEPLEIIYPEDGIVLSDYPLLLLDPAHRASYDTVVTWLKSETGQRRIMERTLRRPVDPNIPRDPRLAATIGNALFFPDQPEVVDKLLANYDPRSAVHGQVIFLLDFSGSMKGDRIAALRSTFDGLSGADSSSTGRFLRFYQGEKFVLTRFGGQVLAERSFTIGGQADIDAIRAFLATDQFDGRTAVWSALDHAYQTASRLVRDNPGQPVTIVLMTDGESNAGIDFEEFLRRHGSLPPEARAVHTYTIRYGDADPAALDRAARATGGQMVDASATSLHEAFKKTRGCR
ncbi:VWA domain-containing protein [Kibdelosporangium persicum]|uniref:von Willebrand Factor Type A n=1 Tax=Kibdelosporangium persicum TaxID=2698649 RepID=A0ABX2FB52_9PSEU|nr:VWA domain-containing protein [Kibdelosporangium persicum]NRN68589.1 von Willebrand Factor Type A [Kibdelosporangium persicum]